MMDIKVSLDSVQELLSKRGLSADGFLRQQLADKVAEYAEPYTPKLTGNLINSKTVANGSITYQADYAAKQYYFNKGKGLRGQFWIQRMWADKGSMIVSQLQEMLR